MDTSLSPTPETPSSTLPPLSAEELRRQRLTWAGIIGASILLLAAFVTALYYLLGPAEAGYVARIRDVFIIIMAFMSLLIGLALTILMVQLARLINLLQNEVKPILDSTNETVSTLRGTTEFLSENLVEPVIKLNEYMAALRKMGELLGLGRK